MCARLLANGAIIITCRTAEGSTPTTAGERRVLARAPLKIVSFALRRVIIYFVAQRILIKKPIPWAMRGPEVSCALRTVSPCVRTDTQDLCIFRPDEIFTRS
jgi:hypothetical protein